MKDLKDCSEKELKDIIKNANQRIDEIEKAKEEERKRKENYHLIELPPKYDINYEGFYDSIMGMDFGEENNKRIQEIAKEFTFEISTSKEDIFPCPVCGETSLYIADYSDYLKYRYRICCGCCDFATDKEFDNEYDVWYNFAKWLVKNGYLSEMPKI